MRCRKARRLISDAADGRLPEAARSGLEGHLEGCPSCLAYRDLVGRIQAGLRDGAEGRAQARSAGSFLAGLNARIDALPSAGPARTPRRVRGPLLRPAFALAFMASALFLTAYLAFLAGRAGKAPAADASAWLSSDRLSQALQEAYTDTIFGADLDKQVRASLAGVEASKPVEIGMFSSIEPLFWESMTKEEMESLAADLKAGK